jgi:uncharacterized protein YacL
MTTSIGVSVLGGSIFGLIFYFITPWVIKMTSLVNGWTQAALKAIPTQDIAVGVVGLILGLLIGSLLGIALHRIPLVGGYLSPVATILLGYLGMSLMLSRKEEMPFLTGLFTRQARVTAVISAVPRFWIPVLSLTGVSLTFALPALWKASSSFPGLCWKNCAISLIHRML